MQYFTEYDIDMVTDMCEKLEPEAHLDPNTQEYTIIHFPSHEICIIKGHGEISRDEGKTYQHADFYLVREMQHVSEDQMKIGEDIAPPSSTIIEAIFTVLAIVTVRLPKDLANSLHYETYSDITRH